MRKKDAHDEAIYLIQSYIEGWQYDVARGCCELAHGIGIISDKEYDRWLDRIEYAKENFKL